MFVQFLKTTKGKIIMGVLLLLVILILGTVVWMKYSSNDEYYSKRVIYHSEKEMLDDLCWAKWYTCTGDGFDKSKGRDFDEPKGLDWEKYAIYRSNYKYITISSSGTKEYDFTLDYKNSEIIHKENGKTYYSDVIEEDGMKYIRSEGLERGFVGKEVKRWMLRQKVEDSLLN